MCAVFLRDRVEVIPNDQGNRTTPSRVALEAASAFGVVAPTVCIGDAAMNLSARGAMNVVYDAKRVIGRKFKDKEVQKDSESWPFKIKENEKDGGVILCAQCGSGENIHVREWEPEEVSALVLKYLKECAERYMGKTVQKAVITVPAYFNDAQRERTKAAGRIAGLDVLRIINEPTAAALAYGIGTPQVTAANGTDTVVPQNVLVFDFGGGTFDVSVITIDNGTFEVRSTAGDTHLGGQDIDGVLLQYVISEGKKQFNKDISSDPKAIAKLRLICEKTKRALSFSLSDNMMLENIYRRSNDDDDSSREIYISRSKFEDLNDKLFKRCMEIVKKALADSTIKKQDISQVILVGGSSRIPKIQQLLSDMFGEKTLCHSVNPDEAVAIGAAIQGSILSNAPEQQSERSANIILMDVVSLSIGIDADGGKFDIIVPRNTTIPYSATKQFCTSHHMQENVNVCVYEGERPLVKHNHLLGSFWLEGITKKKKGMVDISITFNINEDGMLQVLAEEDVKGKSGGGKKSSLNVTSKDRLSNDAVEEMIKKADNFQEEDNKQAALIDTLRNLKSTLDDVIVGSAELVVLCKRYKALKNGKKNDPAVTSGLPLSLSLEAPHPNTPAINSNDDDYTHSNKEEVITIDQVIPPKIAGKLRALQAPAHWLLHKSDKAESVDAIKGKVEKLSALLAKALRAVTKGIKKVKNGLKPKKRPRSDDGEYSSCGSGGEDESTDESSANEDSE